MTRGTVSQTLSLLEKKGCITKTTDTLDRRVVHLALSQTGKTVLKQARPAELFIKASALLEQKSNLNDYETIFSNALTALQKANGSQSFGQCKTCHYFTTTDDGFLCSLTRQQLSDSDSKKLCQEHTVVLSRY